MIILGAKVIPIFGLGGIRPLLAIYDALVARFGVAADERFKAVLNGITQERHAGGGRSTIPPTVPRPRTPEQQAVARAGRAAYMKGYRSATKTEAVG